MIEHMFFGEIQRLVSSDTNQDIDFGQRSSANQFVQIFSENVIVNDRKPTEKKSSTERRERSSMVLTDNPVRFPNPNDTCNEIDRR